MPKVLISADLHIHENDDPKHIQDCLDALKWIYKTAEENSITDVIFAGDFMHDRFKLSTFAYASACDIVINSSKKDINSYFLLGNHDMFYEDNWSINSLVPLKPWSNVIDAPQTIEIQGYPLDFIPYSPVPSKIIESFKPKSDTLFSHLSVSEAVLNLKYNKRSTEDISKDKEMLNPNILAQKWKKTFLGHFHCPQLLLDGKVEYIGTPLSHDYGDVDNIKHIIIRDLETSKSTYIKNEFSPYYYSPVIKTLEDLEAFKKSKFKNDYVFVEVLSSIASPQEIREIAEKWTLRDLEVVPFSIAKLNSIEIKQSIDEAISIFSATNVFVDDYIDQLETNLDKDTLKKIASQVMGGKVEA